MLARRTESARVAQFIVDQAVLALVFGASWLGARALADDPSALPGPLYLRLGLWTLPAAALALVCSGSYRFQGGFEAPERVRRRDALRSAAAATLALVLVAFLLRPEPLSGGAAPAWSRTLVGLVLVLGTPALWLARLGLARVLGRLAGRPAFTARVLVLGSSKRLLRLLHALERGPQVNLELVGVAADDAPRDLHPRIDPSAAIALLEQGRVDHVLVEPDDLSGGRLDRVLRAADREGISVHLTSALFPSTHLVPAWETIGGVPVLGFVSAELDLGARVIKRLFDVVLAGAALVLLGLPMLLIGLLVKLESRGGALFSQERVGAGGQSFRMLKFRTMRPDAEAGGPTFAVENDRRCTRLGRLLRRWNLDELPQLLNVLRGDMSLVGPRPERPEFVGGFKRTIPRYAHKHWVKPGITGWAQIHGLRGASTSLQERIEHDLYYIEHWSLGLDLRILMRTVWDGYANAA